MLGSLLILLGGRWARDIRPRVQPSRASVKNGDAGRTHADNSRVRARMKEQGFPSKASLLCAPAVLMLASLARKSAPRLHRSCTAQCKTKWASLNLSKARIQTFRNPNVVSLKTPFSSSWSLQSRISNIYTLRKMTYRSYSTENTPPQSYQVRHMLLNPRGWKSLICLLCCP